MWCRVVLSRVVSCRVVWCGVVSSRVVSCRVVWCGACGVVSCRVVSCHVVSCGVHMAHVVSERERERETYSGSATVWGHIECNSATWSINDTCARSIHAFPLMSNHALTNETYMSKLRHI